MATHTPKAGSGPVSSIVGSYWDVSYSANTAAGTTDVIVSEGFALGSVSVPNGSSVTTLTWYAAPDLDTTPVALKDQDGVAVTQTVAADETHELPSALAGCRVIAAVTNAAGTLNFHFER